MYDEAQNIIDGAWILPVVDPSLNTIESKFIKLTKKICINSPLPHT